MCCLWLHLLLKLLQSGCNPITYLVWQAGEILKFVGSCCENFVQSKIVSSVVVRKCHPERMLAKKLCFPLWCWEYKIELCSIRMRARCLDRSSYIGLFQLGSWWQGLQRVVEVVVVTGKKVDVMWCGLGWEVDWNGVSLKGGYVFSDRLCIMMVWSFRDCVVCVSRCVYVVMMSVVCWCGFMCGCVFDSCVCMC